MTFTLAEMRLINEARRAKLSPEARERVAVKAASVTPVTVDLTSVEKPATVKKSSKVRWEFRPSYTLGRCYAGPVPGVWCKVSTPKVNRGLEKRRHNQAKHQTARWRAGSSILYKSA